jgi:acyl-coenzyme A thioesterase PaaI-like protein
MGDERPVSAARLAEQLFDQLPMVDSIPPSSFDLVAGTRQLVEAVVMTDVDDAERAAIVKELAALTGRLNAVRRLEPLYLVRHPDGRVESMLNAGSGRLNPQAAPLEWIHRPTEPAPGSEPTPVEVLARCTYAAQHAGSPGRVYGGVLALTLDEALGIAVRASGAGGMTVSITVSLKAGTPVDEPVEVRARYTGHEGRKSYASGEIVANGVVTAEATAIFVSERR